MIMYKRLFKFYDPIQNSFVTSFLRLKQGNILTFKRIIKAAINDVVRNDLSERFCLSIYVIVMTINCSKNLVGSVNIKSISFY